ncbi:MAG: 30S ribosomal protein S9 [Planctomycetes bacterium]|nr:30S ribosomal protein S9 [Planctomycetota bacterium]
MENEVSESQAQPNDPVVATEGAAAAESAAASEPVPAAEGSVVDGLTLGTSAASAEPAAPVVRLPTVIRGKIDASGTAISTGRRKTAVARVRLKKGTGKVTVNGRAFEEYFPVERHRLLIEAPLKATGMYGQVDIWVRASGGGINGQAGAVILGIARAVQALHPELHGPLSDGGFLTRDDRMVERKKYGHKKARRSFQFSKR